MASDQNQSFATDTALNTSAEFNIGREFSTGKNCTSGQSRWELCVKLLGIRTMIC